MKSYHGSEFIIRQSNHIKRVNLLMTGSNQLCQGKRCNEACIYPEDGADARVCSENLVM